MVDESLINDDIDNYDDIDIEAEGYEFGHEIYCLESEQIFEDGEEPDYYKNWRYKDTNELVDDSQKRKCKFCQGNRTEGGHDPCISNLPGVDFACCGHGVEQGYIKFKNGIVVRGIFKVENSKTTYYDYESAKVFDANVVQVAIITSKGSSFDNGEYEWYLTEIENGMINSLDFNLIERCVANCLTDEDLPEDGVTLFLLAEVWDENALHYYEIIKEL